MTLGISAVNTNDVFLNFFLHSNSTTAPAGTFVQLHTADPGASGTTSISVGSTTRVTTSQTLTSHALVISGTNPTWTNGGTSETISHISVWSAITAGTFMYSVALTTGQAWASGNTFTLTTLGFAFTPIAA